MNLLGSASNEFAGRDVESLNSRMSLGVSDELGEALPKQIPPQPCPHDGDGCVFPHLLGDDPTPVLLLVEHVVEWDGPHQRGCHQLLCGKVVLGTKCHRVVHVGVAGCEGRGGDDHRASSSLLSVLFDLFHRQTRSFAPLQLLQLESVADDPHELRANLQKEAPALNRVDQHKGRAEQVHERAQVGHVHNARLGRIEAAECVLEVPDVCGRDERFHLLV
mmetsp:Transcript_25354/g.59823  ORF Transcript_25354/g.59823 Transcript_25354/m.59823 type:complete len:219 (-) Transcript_25354:472-1128(-)